MSSHAHWLLDGLTGWRAVSADRVVASDSLHLRSLPGPAHPLGDAQGLIAELGALTAISIDTQQHIYVLDGPAHTVRLLDPCVGTAEELPCMGGPGREPRQLYDPRGLAVSAHNDLYVADTGNRRIQIFALKGLALRAIWGPLKVIRDGSAIRVEPSAPRPGPSPTLAELPSVMFPPHTWQPWGIAVAANSRVFVSDAENGLIHVFDPRGNWRTAFTGASEDYPPLSRPTCLTLDPSGRIYVVDEARTAIRVLSQAGEWVGELSFPADTRRRVTPGAIVVDGEGNLYLSDSATRRIYMYPYASDGSSLPVGTSHLLREPGNVLAVDCEGNLVVGDTHRRLIVRVEVQTAYETEGCFVSDVLDGRDYRCQWHRVLMHSSIPQGTYLRVATFTSETPWPAQDILDLPDSRWETSQINAQAGTGEWDCLVQSPPGRYLWLRLWFFGNQAETPQVNWIEVYYPRVSSLRFLPAVYQMDPVSGDFMDRFLSIFDSLWDGLSDRLTDIALYLDPMSTPATREGERVDFLSWLASWIGLALDRHWPEEKRRRLVRMAHRLFALRGTPAGLRLHVQLYTGLEPHILEHFMLRRWVLLNEARLDDQFMLWGPAVMRRLQLDEYSQVGDFQLIDSGDPLTDPFYHAAHQFTVFIPVRSKLTEVEQQTLDRIVELAKPAHTHGKVQVVQPRFRVGVQAFIGVDTVIARYPDEIIESEGQLGYDTVLGPSPDESEPPTLRIGKRSRIGSNTLLD